MSDLYEIKKLRWEKVSKCRYESNTVTGIISVFKPHKFISDSGWHWHFRHDSGKGGIATLRHAKAEAELGYRKQLTKALRRVKR